MNDIEQVMNVPLDCDRIQLMKTFGVESRKQVNELLTLIGSRSWYPYVVLVHGMKSALKTIGALELGESARELEYAAKNSDFAFCINETNNFAKRVLKLADDIKASLCKLSKNDCEKEFSDQNDVMELLLELLDACQNFNMTATDQALSKLKNKTVSPDFDKKLADIIDKAEVVEYEEAAAAIEEILSEQK